MVHMRSVEHTLGVQQMLQDPGAASTRLWEDWPLLGKSTHHTPERHVEQNPERHVEQKSGLCSCIGLKSDPQSSVNGTVFGNRILADLIKMRSCWTRVGSKSSDVSL